MNTLMIILFATVVTVSSVEAPQKAEDNTVVQSARTVPAWGPWTAGATSPKARGACPELTSDIVQPRAASLEWAIRFAGSTAVGSNRGCIEILSADSPSDLP